ncbi:Predicted thiol-disulfide oxidoreductase YuxK, DCC family [Marinococcus luteus]|uniref:Predicted thiol-disulfide oxidoreductase YuxK, DCC family n=1 Tax=Marinococcus luteus TaxID=1122204 RepID=A0A1H2XNG1_9BACI|nr:DUF393 domain-containing protein [Marinococcus luteus]SDW94373.1 Predicted thiol-disulfide oxidoreductase YuxK, DCC family [Marinococcus luteus]
MGQQPEFIVFYDSDCPLCTRFHTYLSAIDKKNRVNWKPIYDEDLFEKYPMLKGEPLEEQMHSVEDNTYVYAGYFTVKKLCYTIPALKPLKAVFLLPGVETLGRKLYHTVSVNRYQWFHFLCDDKTCQRGGH